MSDKPKLIRSLYYYKDYDIYILMQKNGDIAYSILNDLNHIYSKGGISIVCDALENAASYIDGLIDNTRDLKD